ncbi:MAG: L-Ala-D/L-Glu epimerase [Alphaproteobacteria bacterium]|nr:L-Ala-D/L-Glu epimerase [Alphaproteobacteria bacterium]MCB9931608.1 L-Ala-D/L-Glu epimerase [Alphaproteobacteria bacterium]
MRQLTAAAECFPIRGRFAIARGARTESRVVTVTLTEGAATGRGECVPYARYGESLESVLSQIETVRDAVEQGGSWEALAGLLPAGAARNALDCALWDLEAKQAGKRAWDLAGLPEPPVLTTAYTLSLDTPEAMGSAASAQADRPLLKIKLAGDARDRERVAAIRAAAPNAKLIVDANEGASPETVEALCQAMAELGVAMVEQPIPADQDDALLGFAHPLPICADEAFHTRRDLARIAERYDLVNIKLDKTGGLTEALAVLAEAEERGLGVMVGCMLGTSLAMAPAVLVAARAQIVDLDGPLLLAADREPGLVYEGSRLHPPPAALWG